METRRRVYHFALILVAFLALGQGARTNGQRTPAALYNIGLRTPHPDMAKLVPAKGITRAGDLLASESSGWDDLMLDKSLKGWTRVSVPPGKALDPVNQWKVDKENRTIVCGGDHGHEWLRFDRELTNFLLHVEWRFEKREGLKGYNSGFFVRNGLDGRIWHQAQVGTSAFIFGQTLIHGELSPMIKTPPRADSLHPIGEWNTYEIRCDGPKITLWVNGELTSEFAAPEVSKGYWGLEGEGYRIEFRNIKLKNLP